MENEFLPQKKIACISTIGGKVVIAIGAMIDGTLAVLKMEELTGPFNKWRNVMKEKISVFQKEGLSVYIEADNFDYFSLFGTVIMLDQVDDVDKRTYQSIALDKYYSLTQMGSNTSTARGCLRLAKELQQHWITDDIVNVKFDDRGRRVYDVEAESFTTHQRALLCCVLAATHLNEYNEDACKELLGLIVEEEPYSPMKRVGNIFEGIRK